MSAAEGVEAAAASSASLSSLAAWLQAHYPSDVIMPVPLGTKRPVVPYRDEAYTWQRFAAARAEAEAAAGEACDWCVALRALCVIDADSAEAARALEARFPALRAAPRAHTRRGVHWWFARSTRADAGSFYDGCGQVMPHVDFKTVCSTGTPGIIMVPPSTDKVWERAPWEVGVIAIPDDLLDAVAKPKAAAAAAAAEVEVPAAAVPPAPTAPAALVPDEVRLIFTGAEGAAAAPADAPREELLVRGPAARLLATSVGYTSALLSGRWPLPVAAAAAAAAAGEVPCLQVPCERDAFEELLAVLEHGELPLTLPPTPARLVRLEVTADMLGVGDTHLHSVRVPSLARLTFHADLYALQPAWWRANAKEEVALRAGGDMPLVAVDAALAAKLVYAPLAKEPADRWLFAAQPTAPGLAPGAPVLRADPAAAALRGLPPAIVALLQAHRDCLVVAGGAAAGAIGAAVQPGTDIDLFVHGLSAAAADAVAADVARALARTHEPGKRSALALSFEPRKASWREGERPVQLVLCLFASPAQVLLAFDVAPTKVLIRAAPTGAALRVEALPAAVEALRAMAFWVDTAVWCAASTVRIIKYGAKGFEVALPGLRRAAFRKPPPAPGRHLWFSARHTVKFGDTTLAGLFDAEASVLEALASRARSGRPTPRVDGGDASDVADAISGHVGGPTFSGYGSEAADILAKSQVKDYSAIFRIVGRPPVFRRSTGGAARIPFAGGKLLERQGNWVSGCVERFQERDPHVETLHDGLALFLAGADEARARADAVKRGAICAACGRLASLVCTKCHAVHYCNKACQGADWRAGHKAACKAAAK